MSNRGEFVGTAPTSGNYIPAPTPAEQEDLPVYINDELLRLGGVVNGVLEGGSLPPHSELPKRYKEGMIMNFSSAVGGGVDSSGVWLYKNAKWWKLIDDPTTITDEIYERIDEVVSTIDSDIADLNSDLDNLNNITLPALNAELDNLNNVTLPELESDLSRLDGKFPITTTDISDGAITTPKMIANTILGDRIVTNSLSGNKITANTINGNKIIANTINGDRIIANTINGNKILANSIRGDKIVANSIVGGKISSATTIRAGSGNTSASLDGADPNWRIYAGSATPANAPFRVDKDGNLFATTGSFGGTIYADKVEGDFTSVAIKKIPDGFAPFSGGTGGVITPKELFKIRVERKPYVRYVKIDPVSFDFEQNGSKSAYHMLAHGIAIDSSGNTVGPQQELVGNYDAYWWQDSVEGNETNYGPSITVQIPANVEYQVTVSIGVESSSNGGHLWQQDLTCTLFKQGTELSFV